MNKEVKLKPFEMELHSLKKKLDKIGETIKGAYKSGYHDALNGRPFKLDKVKE